MNKHFLVSLLTLATLFFSVSRIEVRAQEVEIGPGALDTVVGWTNAKMLGSENLTTNNPDSDSRKFYERTICQKGTMNREAYLAGDCKANGEEFALLPNLTQTTVALLTEPPASMAYYMQDLRQDFLPNTNSAYAQGIGFASLSPFLPMWKISRNIAYFFMILMFLVVGFAIMFRAKLNPQTVVSIEQALPSLVVTLVLITFSYAIAGLLIDVMYIAIYLIIGVFSAGGLSLPGGQNATDIAFGSFLSTIISNLIGGEGFMIGGFTGLSDLVKGALLPKDNNNPLAGGLATVLGGGGGAIFTTIFTIVIITTAFRVFFKLLTAYAQVLILVVTGPVRFLLNAFPGSNAFMDWLKALGAQLAVFPTVAITLFFVFMLSSNAQVANNLPSTTSAVNAQGGSRVVSGFVPPMIGSTDSGSLLSLVSLAILLATPGIIDGVQKALGGGSQDSPFGAAAMGGALGGVLGSTAGAASAPFKPIAGIANTATSQLYTGALGATAGAVFGKGAKRFISGRQAMSLDEETLARLGGGVQQQGTSSAESSVNQGDVTKTKSPSSKVSAIDRIANKPKVDRKDTSSTTGADPLA